MYRTECAMYDEVSVGNPGKVPYCTEQDKIEPDCQHCKRPYVTNADRIRAMTDEELAKWLDDICDPYLDSIETGRWLEWLKQECES